MCGISCTNARANPTNRSPNVGDSRRANATTDPTDRATSCGATTSREHRNRIRGPSLSRRRRPLHPLQLATRSTRSRSVNTADPHPPTTPGTPSTTPTATEPPAGSGGTAHGIRLGTELNWGTAEPGSTTRPTTTPPSMH